MGRRARKRGQWSTTCRWCTTGWAWCATNAMIAHQQCPTLATNTAGRTVGNWGREILISQFYLGNYQKKPNHLSWGSKQGGQDRMAYTRFPVGNTPICHYSPGGGPVNKVSPTNLHTLSPVLPHDSTGQLPGTLEVHKMKFKVDNKTINNVKS